MKIIMTVDTYSYSGDGGSTWEVFNEEDLEEAAISAVAWYFNDGSFEINIPPKEQICLTTFYAGYEWKVVFSTDCSFSVERL